MQRPAELDLALDVQNLAITHADARRDAGRLTEAKTTELQHAQPIDLPDLGAIGIDQHRIVGDRFIGSLADAGEASVLLLQRLLDVAGGQHIVACLLRPEIRLANEVDDRAHAHRELVRRARQARTLIDDARDRRRIERPDVLAPRNRAQKTRIEEVGILLPAGRPVPAGRLVPLQDFLEVGGDFEQVRKIGIGSGELVVEPAITEQDDLHIERNRCWFEGGGRHRTGGGAGRFDFDACAPKRTLERVPGVRFRQ